MVAWATYQKDTPTQGNADLYVLKKLWTRLWTPLRHLKFSHVYLIEKCSLLHQNNSHHSGAW